MSNDFASKFESRVPRYTSYPTAVQFTDIVDGETYRRWLAELDPAQPISIYLHVPFCKSMCWFCGCYTKVVNRYSPIAQYLEILRQEIDLIADTLPGRFTVSHIHWGGGSPNIVDRLDWLDIFGRLRERFDVARGAEIAVELDPRTTSQELVRTLADVGVNRASIGVQDFHPEIQRAINREQSLEVTSTMVGWLRDTGINDINVDLLYGLPRQSASRVAETVDMAASLKPSRFALFGYAHVPWMRTHQKLIDEDDLPGPLERWAQYQSGTDRLVKRGYQPIGIDHFALSDDSLTRASARGDLKRNFQGYTTDRAEAMIGFGASAISALPQGHVQNAPSLTAYSKTVSTGILPVKRGVELSDDDRLRHDVIERLMCNLEADVGEICASHSVDINTLDTDIARLDPLIDDGIVLVDGRWISVLPDARPLARLVAATFDAYLVDSPAQHSQAV